MHLFKSKKHLNGFVAYCKMLCHSWLNTFKLTITSGSDNVNEKTSLSQAITKGQGP
jgi:hypothetical protein